MDYNSNFVTISTNNNICQMVKEEHQSYSICIEKDDHLQFCEKIKQKLERLNLFINSIQNQKIKDQSLRKLQLDPKQLQGINSQIVLKQISDRVQKLIRNKQTKRIRRNWTSLDMKVFIWIVCIYAQEQNIDVTQIHLKQDFWQFITSVLPGTSAQSCLFKWLGEKDHKVTMFQWSEKQENLLVQIEELHKNEKNKWKIVSEELFLMNKDHQKIFRTPKQCREHYTSFLDPNLIKGPWSEKEDHTLLTHTILNKGKKKWCKLAQVLKGRTQNAIKNRYHLIVNKLANLKENRHKEELQLVEEYLLKNDPEFQQRKEFLMEIKNVKQKQQKEKKQAENNKKSIKRSKKDKKTGQVKNRIKDQKIKVQRVEFISGQNQMLNVNLQKISVVKEQYNYQQEQIYYQPISLQTLEQPNKCNNDFIEPSRSSLKEDIFPMRPFSFQFFSDGQFDYNSSIGLNWPTIQFIPYQYYTFCNNPLNMEINGE